MLTVRDSICIIAWTKRQRQNIISIWFTTLFLSLFEIELPSIKCSVQRTLILCDNILALILIRVNCFLFPFMPNFLHDKCRYTWLTIPKCLDAGISKRLSAKTSASNFCASRTPCVNPFCAAQRSIETEKLIDEIDEQRERERERERPIEIHQLD